VGPTASGKTSLSIQLAKKFSGEIISADSRQVYRGLDLGTGKVKYEEMQAVPHHLLDVAEPTTVYTVADFVRDGRAAITDILSYKKLPLIVGGTFFYIDALLGKVSTPEVPPNEVLREMLDSLSNNELYILLLEKDPERAKSIDKDNKRRLVRALEIVDSKGVVPMTQPVELYDALTIGITLSPEQLHKNIHERLIKRIDEGMVEEVETLHKNGLSYERMEELGLEYRYIAEFLQNKITRDEMFRLIETKSRQYAKRQMTWLKRDRTIHWFNVNDTVGIDGVVRGFLEED
jgi:tRNA dimethylallyltransferase